ncbi:MAG TPA: acyl-CoA dehydrogenase family protein [Candidatus Binatia bacterium]|nr:acyl-CoA dehydrogenase family protein [Candidatus Binatia bacterium]
MDFQLTEEQKLIQNTAAQFVQRELLPREGAYLKQAELFLPPGDPARRELDPGVKGVLTQRAKQAGLWALELPESAGGSAMNVMARVFIYREFGRTILPFAPLAVPELMGANDQVQEIVDGKLALVFAFDEVHKTGALQGIKTRYREISGGYLLGNASIDVIGPGADLYLFPAKEEGTERAGLFLLDKHTTGVSVVDEVDLTTDATVARLILRDCKLRREQLVGYEFEVASIIASEQLRVAARSLGMGMRCLASSIEHARNRVTFDRPLAQRQAIQWMLADLSIDLRSCTWLTLEAAWRADQELPYFQAAALAKKRAAKMAFEAADTAIQIHGGYGVCKEFPFEGFYREARLMRLLYGREGEIDRAIGERFLQSH